MTQVAFVFPGQGSQSVGMLAAAHAEFADVPATFAEASDALGYDVWALVCDGPAEQLALTEFTQPVILTASVALFRSWQTLGGAQPALVGGHSLGEFSALVAAGSLDFADALRLVRARGRAMQAAVPVGIGAMAAIIGLDDAVITDTCAQISTATNHVSAVNFNAPGQVVIAGHSGAVAAAVEALKAAGAKRALPLPVSAPFHTPLMQPAADALAAELASLSLSDAALPVVSNVNAELLRDAAQITALLVRQIASPVQWTRCVQTLEQAGCSSFVECGPGKVLSGLIRRTSNNATTFATETPDALREALAALAPAGAAS